MDIRNQPGLTAGLFDSINARKNFHSPNRSPTSTVACFEYEFRLACFEPSARHGY
jgi:hypothetical protein